MTVRGNVDDAQVHAECVVQIEIAGSRFLDLTGGQHGQAGVGVSGLEPANIVETRVVRILWG